MINSNITVKGIFIKFNIDRIKTELGVEALKKAEEQYGKPLQFSAVANYPVDEEIKIINIIGKMIYPNLSENERWIKLGIDDANIFITSQLGRVGLSLFFPNLITGINNASKLFSLLHTGMVCKPIVDDKSISLNILNNPYHPNYYVGFFERVLQFKGINRKIKVTTNGKNCIYTVI